MTFTTSDGRNFRIQFVHSAHDLRYRNEGTPGGLRQLVDNLAASLRRRVTLCEISLVTLTGAVDGDGRALTQATPLAQGFALCHYHDQFVKRLGRGYSLARALSLGDFDVQTAAEIADFCDFEYEDLREL